MNILVALVTKRALLQKAFKDHQDALLRPADAPLSLGTINFTVEIIDGNALEQHVHDELLQVSAGYDAAAVILDGAATPRLSSITNGLFVYRISLPEFIPNVLNTLVPLTKRFVKSFCLLLEKFEKSEQFYAAAVPLRNFDAAEARALRELFGNLTLAGNFNNAVARTISGLIDRRSPKRNSRFPDQYLVDDSRRYFKFGHELHSDFDTAPPHTSSCAINGLFRFGKRLPRGRHFNVSLEKGRIFGTFLDCHDALVQVRERTHLNMFSSDFQT